MALNQTKRVKCTCKNEFQDSQYGKGIRSTTPVNREQKNGAFVVRCTVCGVQHNLGVIAK